MSNEVYANGREISCKSAEGKAVCAFPDVCLTPPPPPAGFIPVPYPNTGFATDATNGSKTVQISGKEVMLKNKSYFKKSTGDEAATRSTPMGVLTHTITGKIYFTSWSMDVKVEGENVVRHLDLTTHNHMSMPGNSPPWPYLDGMAAEDLEKCQVDQEREQAACGYDAEAGDYTMTPAQACQSNQCQAARKCMLVPYGGSGSPNCCSGQTGHHMIEDHWVTGNAAMPGNNAAGHTAAPTVCASGTRYTQDHGEMHMLQGLREESYMPGGANAGQPWDYGAGKSAALFAHEATFDNPRCSRDCLAAQLDAFYGEDETRPLNPPGTQPLARNDPGDNRWTRQQAQTTLGSTLGRP